MEKISVVIPVHNEEEIIEKSSINIMNELRSITDEFELVLVDDGSTDQTWNLIEGLSQEFQGVVRGISFSRNFGKEAAIFAGLTVSTGDAVITMDADMQHPPEKIAEFVNRWKEGYKIVEGIKLTRGKERIFHRVFSAFFYYIMTKATGVDMNNTSDFKLLDRSVVNIILSIQERELFYRAITRWIGIEAAVVTYEVGERMAGSSKWSYKSLFKYAIRNISMFTSMPLYFVLFLGGVFFLLGFMVAFVTVYKYVIGVAIEGFTTVILLQLFTGGIIMMSLGIIGFYITNITSEVRKRPRYIISRWSGRTGE